MNEYRGKPRDFPFINGMSFNTGLEMNFVEPFVARQETLIVETPDLYSDGVYQLQKLQAGYHALSVAEDSPSDTVKVIASPVVVSSAIVPPRRSNSCPAYEPANWWDTMSQ